MKLNYFILLPLLLFFSSFSVSGQTAWNVNLLNQQLRPGATRYSGSWVYVGANGAEYALLGANIGLVAYDLENNFQEVGFIPGPTSNWREIMVIGDYAYVVTEGTGSGQGMQIVDLSFLPDSLHLSSTYTQAFTRGHIIQKDHYHPEVPFLYVNGITPGGDVLFLDVSNPLNPVVAGSYGPYYIHDCHVRGDTMYASAVFEGVTDIVDISDKANPVLIQQITFPGAFPHSSFTSKNHDFLFATDEIDGLPMKTFDLTDLDNITEVDQYTADPGTLVHNPYVRGDFLFISHNSAGLRVLDIAKPDLPVEVGYYDTFAGSSGGSSGLWSACPFLPSGKIIGGDRQSGLFVWSFNNTKAGRIYGGVVDSISMNPVFDASIFLETTTDTTHSDLIGNFKLGKIPGTYDITCSKSGYIMKTMQGISLGAGDSLNIQFELVPDLPISIAESGSDDFQILLFPNPATDFLNIEIKSGVNRDQVLSLYHIDGKLLLKQKLFEPFSRIEMDRMPSGIIIYELSDVYEQIIQSGKIVKE